MISFYSVVFCNFNDFRVSVRVMVLNATFNKISIIWRGSVVLMEETGVPEEPTCRKSLTNLITYCCIDTSGLSRVRTHNVSGDMHR